MSAALALCSLAAAPPAAPRTPEVDALYQAAKAQLDKGELAAALVGFDRCLELVAGDEVEEWTMLLGMATALNLMDRAADAATLHAHLAARIEPSRTEHRELWRSLRKRSQSEAARLGRVLRSTHGVVDLWSATPGAVVVRDDAPLRVGSWVAVTPVHLYLPAGTHELTLERPGSDPVPVHVRVTAGRAVEIQSRPTPKPAPAAKPPPPLPPPAAPTVAEAPGPQVTAHVEDPAPSQGVEVAGWALLGAGLAVAAVGIPFTVRMEDNGRDIASLDPLLGPEEGTRQYNALADEYRLNAGLQGLFYGLGGAAMVTGVVLLLTADEDDGSVPVPTAGVVPLRGGGVLTASGRF